MEWISVEEGNSYPSKPLSIHAFDGYETYLSDDNTIGVRPKWISVKDRLPEKDFSVLTFDGTYIEVMEYWYDEEGKQIWFNPPSPPKDNVTHWMPLPKPPITKIDDMENK